MDWTSIIVAAFALVGTFSGSALGIRQSNKIVELRLVTLEKKMDKHNNVIERMAVVEHEVESSGRRLDKVENTLLKVAK